MGNKILVADDEPTVLGFIKEFLNLKGYHVDAYLNGNDAFMAFQNNPAQYHLVITDQTMPNMLGIELIQKIQAIRPVTAILCTGYSEQMDQDEARKNGATELISKPFNSCQLLEVVQNAFTASE